MAFPPLTAVTEHLRSLSDADLAALLRARPDLAVPAPRDFTSLAGRAANGYSLVRAAHQLTLFEARVLEVLLALDEPTLASVRQAMAPWAAADRTDAALRRLQGLALAWHDGESPQERIEASPGLPQVVPRPLGLGPAAAQLYAALTPTDLAVVARALKATPHAPAERRPGPRSRSDWPSPETVAALLAESLPDVLAAAPPPAREALQVVADGAGMGQIDGALDRTLDPESRNPVVWLMAHGLLVATGETLVESPREVTVAVRGHLVPAVSPDPPDAAGASHGAAGTDAAAAAAAGELLRHTCDLLDLWADEPPSTLRAGGLGVREMRRAARAVALPEDSLAVLVTTAYAAGLLAPSADDEGMVLLPTTAYDAWLEDDAATRWVHLAAAWLDARRWPALARTGVAPAPGEPGRAVALLSGDDVRADAPEIRRDVLGVLATLPAGTAPDVARLADVLRWHRPYRNDPAPFVDAVLAEAAFVGLLGRGALASPARELLAGAAERARTRLTAVLPAPVEEVLVQADHTVVVPGPLRPDLARAFGLIAERESAGAATVYRVTETSLRRALDAGMAAGDVQEFLTAHSRTPVPQSLTYLVADTARRYGRLRIGAATTYVRSDDEAHLAELLADRRLKGLHLRRIAPSVLVAEGSVGHALAALRLSGYAPVAEAADGSGTTPGVGPRRAEQPRGRPGAHRAAQTASVGGGPTALDVEPVVARLRAGDHGRRTYERLLAADRAPPHADSSPSHAAVRTAAVLRDAADSGGAVWLSYVDSNGVVTDHVVEPSTVTGRIMEAYDRLTSRNRVFLLDRVMTAAPLADGPTGPSGPSGQEGSP